LDPKVTVHYQPNHNTLIYASYSQGFKSGGFNAGFLSPAFKPERLKSYEVGLKTDLLDHRFRANLAGFYYDYSNLQVNITEGIQLITRNAAKAELYGLEGQFTFLPIDDLRISLNASYLHSEYKDYISPNPRLPGQGDPGVTLPATGAPAFDLSGNQLAYAPKYKLDGEIAYTIHSNAWAITPRASVTYTARTFFNQFEEYFVSQPAYAKGDVYLDIENKDWNLSVTLFVHNVTDKYYTTSGTVSSDFLGYQVVGALGAPRTFGATILKRF
jgi:iron complex outermembrane receptor protein